MNHKLSVLLARKLTRLGTIPKGHEDIYVYGFELIISFVVSVAVLLFLGIVFHKIVETLIFLTLFIVIRQFTGGFHADTYLKCQICTISFYACVMNLMVYIRPSYIAYVLLMIFGALIILVIGPVESPNKPLSSVSRRKNKLKGFMLFEFVSLISLYFVEIKPYISGVVFYTLFLIIILMIIPFLERRIRHAECNR